MDRVTEIEIKAIYDFVKSEIPYQARISRILRTVTETIQFGQFYGSTYGKLINRTMSREAANLLVDHNAASFARATVLEHSKPLKILYEELLDQPLSRVGLNKFLCNQMKWYPLVTVTKAEDRRLRNEGMPHERYRNAAIEVGTVSEVTFNATPVWTTWPEALQMLVDATDGENEKERDLAWGEGDIEVSGPMRHAN